MDTGGYEGDSDATSGAVAGDMNWATDPGKMPNKTKDNLLFVYTTVLFPENSVYIRSMQKLLCVDI
jgi:hypothetical protein